MLLTRSLPPQFLLPAWSARQLAQAVRRAHKSDSTRDEDNNNDSPARPPTPRQFRRLRYSTVRRLDLKPAVCHNVSKSTRATAEKDLDESRFVEQVHGWDRRKESRGKFNDVDWDRKDEGKGFIKYTPKPRENDTRDGRREFSQHSEKAGTQYMPPEHPPNSEGLSLFEELFPEEALARETRETKAREKLDRLPAFNWAMEVDEVDVRDRRHEQARQKLKEKYTSIPESVSGLARPSKRAKEAAKTWSNGLDHDREKVQNARQGFWSEKNFKVCILILKACSKTLEESDFYRVGPKGNHIESWTNGILKVIPARDNVTLEPLGQYILLFSSVAAARLYLDRTLRLLGLTKSNDFYSKPFGRSRLREGEDLEAVLRNFTLVPAGGKLSLTMVHPPYSKGLQWMIDAGGPAPLVALQEKAQNIILLTTDRGYINKPDLEHAIMADGKRRNLHWKLAGRDEAIVKLESKEDAGEGDGRQASKYRGPARYTISFKDSNEARRFVRDWHRRPFPLSRSPQPWDDAPPIVNVEILW